MDYPTGTVVHEERDVFGRLGVLTRLSTGDASQTAFGWLGELQSSRTTAQASITSTEPLTEFAEYDGFGRRTAWEYTAISPSAPPARIDAIRDVTGRIRSLTTEFGHPITMGTHDVDWRGYQYDRRGYLRARSNVYERLSPVPHDELFAVLLDDASGISCVVRPRSRRVVRADSQPVHIRPGAEREWTNLGPAVDMSSIVPNGHPNVGASVDAAIEALGGSINATPWDQERELEVGGLTAIVDNSLPTPEVLWSITQAREPGHRLSGVEVDGTQYAITHDDAGRLATGPIFDFVYDANHRLSVVEAFGNDVEVYLYTADGDLAAVIGRTRHVFAYDGTQMIAAFDLNGDPQWEATFGDGIDQLIEYRDFASMGPIVPLADHRNSPIATWNPTTEAIEQLARYDLHGRLTLLDANEMQLCVEQDNPGAVCDPPSAMPFAFNGRWRSPLTGLVNMRARWYSPRLGQFTAPDALGYVDLYHLYGFAAFDPVNGWDPFGLADRSLGVCLGWLCTGDSHASSASTQRTSRCRPPPTFRTWRRS